MKLFLDPGGCLQNRMCFYSGPCAGPVRALCGPCAGPVRALWGTHNMILLMQYLRVEQQNLSIVLVYSLYNISHVVLMHDVRAEYLRVSNQ